MKINFVLAALAMSATLLTDMACAQTSPKKVFLSGSTTNGEFEQQVISALGARILATTRYTLNKDLLTADLQVEVVCLDLSNSRLKGGVCSYHFIYWPEQFFGLSCELGVLHIGSDTDPSEISEGIFENFVNASTEKELAGRLSG